MTTEAEGERSRPAEDLSPWILVLTGVTYPAWRVFAPSDAIDPLSGWFAVSGCFLSPVLLHLRGFLSRSTLLGLLPGLASVVALHFFLLAAFNDMKPFYAVGSTMAGLAPVLFVQSRRGMLVYAGFLVALSSALYLESPDTRKIAYWGSLVPVLAFGCQQISNRARHRRELEDAVADRTRRLSDANRRLRAEIEQRARLENEIRVNQKMEAIGRLAGGIAHDFNNVLTTIGVYADLLEKGLAPNDAYRNEVECIQLATRQAAALTRQLLAVGRRSTARPRLVDLDQIVQSTAAVLDHLVGPDIEILRSRGEGRLSILANADQVQQILINLVTNARDAIEGTGRIRIEVAPAKAEEVVAVDGEAAPPNDAYVRLTVEDSGRGMTPDILSKIFDPFFTTKEPDSGSGLGLAIVHGIVSQAGGFVRVCSGPGRGSRFDLYWPRTEPDRVDPETTLPSDQGGGTILLVEDEAPLRMALAQALRSRGYRVFEAPNAERALEMIVGGDCSPELVVTDVVMADMDGFELAQGLRDLLPRTRVLLVSGHLGDSALEHVHDSFPFLAKPFSVTDFLEEVSGLLDDDPVDERRSEPGDDAI